MKIKKKFGAKIYIEWTDAYEAGGWMNLKEMIEIPDEVFCFTNGWYVGEKDGFIIICHTRGKTKSNDMLGKLLIPKAWIRRIK